MSLEDKLGTEWYNILKEVVEGDSFIDSMKELKEERKKHKVYPAAKNTFRAFRLTSPENLKIVILGQDPYYTPDTADGLAFSSQQKTTPGSLLNIFKEIKSNLYPKEEIKDLFKSNKLDAWATQGVFLLNTALTVQENTPNSHHKYWKNFTDEVIKKIQSINSEVIYLSWGKKALEKLSYNLSPFVIKNNVLQSGHPSPLSAKLFLGNKHFLAVNKILEVKKKDLIDWKIYE